MSATIRRAHNRRSCRNTLCGTRGLGLKSISTSAWLRAVLLLCIPLGCASLASGCVSDSIESLEGLPESTRVEESGGYVAVGQDGDSFYVLGEADGCFAVIDGTLRPSSGTLGNLGIIESFEATGYPSDARLPDRLTRDVEMSRLGTGYGSPMQLAFANSERLVLTPAPPVRDIRSVGLSDVTGDGTEDLIVVAVGDPGICSDTNTGYVGFAEARDSGFGEVEWQDSLEAGLASILIADVDNEPGCEIIAGMYETFCTGTPAGIWVFSPGPR